MADRPEGDLPQGEIVSIRQGLGRCHHDRLPGVDPQRVEVFHVADADAVVGMVTDDLVLHLLPARQILLDEHLGRGREGLRGHAAELRLVPGDSRSTAAEREAGAHHHRIPDPASDPQRRDRVARRPAARNLEADRTQVAREEGAVFRPLDGRDRAPKHPDAVPPQDALAVQSQAAVERRLTAERQQDAVRTPLGDHPRDEPRLDGEQEDPIRESG